MTFEQLRIKHKQLIYGGFDTKLVRDSLTVIYNFILSPDIYFRPEIVFPNYTFEPLGLENNLNNLIFNLGMVEMLSYWKATCSPKIVIKAGYLDQEQISFWKKLLIKGLGEFFFNNQIDFTQKDLVDFVIASPAAGGINSAQTPRNDKRLRDRDLVLVGGGKDSAVTLDEISKSGGEYNCLLLNPTDAAIKISEAGGCKAPIIIKRVIDPKLLELNKQGYLNGHTPFSAYLAFLASLAGVIYDYKNIVVSNESSSNEGNVTWMGQEINHQYSKTEGFEKDFKKYSQEYLAPVNYYSYLRNLNELAISEKFSKIEKYHNLFKSCNRGSKMGIWCGECPKCVSTFITLYPYLGEKTIKIFGRNLLKDEKLKPMIEGLMGKNDAVKPFECVATHEEIKKALRMVGYKQSLLLKE